MKQCHNCRREITVSRIAGRREVCPFCRADLHCCLNCEFYDPRASKQCREPVAEPVKIKERSNYCDYFLFSDSAVAGVEEKETEKARKSLDDLFKK